MPKRNICDVTIGRAIRRQRDLAEMSLAALAAASGLLPLQLARFEAGIARVPALDLWAVSKALGVEVAAFFDELAALPAPGGPGGRNTPPPSGACG